MYVPTAGEKTQSSHYSWCHVHREDLKLQSGYPDIKIRPTRLIHKPARVLLSQYPSNTKAPENRLSSHHGEVGGPVHALLCTDVQVTEGSGRPYRVATLSGFLIYALTTFISASDPLHMHP